jgi:predicted phosphodiesterase
MIWTPKVYEEATAALQASNSVTRVCQDLSARWGELISPKALDCAFRRGKLKQPAQWLSGPAGQPAVHWTNKVAKQCAQVIRRHGTVVQACEEISTLLGRTVTPSGLQKVFLSAGLKPPGTYVDKKLRKVALSQQSARAAQYNHKAAFNGAAKATGPAGPVSRGAVAGPGPRGYEQTYQVGEEGQDERQDSQFNQKFLTLVQKQIRTINELADQMDVPPKVIRQTIASLQQQGYGVTLERDQIVGFSAEVVHEVKDAQELTAQPGTDGTYCFGAVADTHFGSKYCDEEAFVQYVEYAYSLGVRHILHAGDILTGLLNHHGMSFEVKTLGFDNQVELALSVMPQKPGLSYFGICGNHELNSWTKSISMSPGAALVRRAREMGRNDIHHVGDVQGRVVFGKGEQSIKVELAHPKVSGSTYAISYPVQKWVERMPGGAKPHILLSGHLHQFSVLNVRNVVCVQPGCFEHSTPYTREMGLHPAVGGVVIWAKRDGLNLWFRNEWVATRTKPVDWTQIE